VYNDCFFAHQIDTIIASIVYENIASIYRIPVKEFRSFGFFSLARSWRIIGCGSPSAGFSLKGPLSVLLESSLFSQKYKSMMPYNYKE
jgi:hypothetical protein